MYMVTMFDPMNQIKLARKLSGRARKEIVDRLVDGGASPEQILTYLMYGKELARE